MTLVEGGNSLHTDLVESTNSPHKAPSSTQTKNGRGIKADKEAWWRDNTGGNAMPDIASTMAITDKPGRIRYPQASPHFYSCLFNKLACHTLLGCKALCFCYSEIPAVFRERR